MKLNANALGLAFAFTTAALWTICSLIVLALPQMSMTMSGYMMHTEFTNLQWSMHFIGFVLGLFIWSVIAGVIGWMIAVVYNRIV
ncbi:MAG: hypothetical protein CMP91_05970 [Gammaproteobacteria bacterium]|nr:hypothetical protein [Gammaproteobacteria bacterium]MAY02899.1 hypothetical protein [Gammaproteobacteria bacterium]